MTRKVPWKLGFANPRTPSNLGALWKEKTVNDTVQHTAIVTLALGNTGALRICMDLFVGYGEEPLRILGELGITGPEVYVLYKYECDEDYEAMYQSLTNGTAMDKLRGNYRSRFNQAMT
jgi:hypothetical protein